MTELEKLKVTANVIQNMTDGRIQIRPSSLGSICVHTADNAYISLNMELKSNLEQKCYDISFSCFVRRMGSAMNAKDLGALYREVHQAQALLTALELTKHQPTLDDLQAFHDHLQQQEQAQQMMQSM